MKLSGKSDVTGLSNESSYLHICLQHVLILGGDGVQGQGKEEWLMGIGALQVHLSRCPFI